ISTSIDIQVRAFCNYGTLQLGDGPDGPVNLTITFSELFANLVKDSGMQNQGQIVVEKTGDWWGSEPMPNGSSITLKSNWKETCATLIDLNQTGQELTQAQQEQLLHCDDNNDDWSDDNRKGLFGLFYNEGKIEAGRGYGEITLDDRPWPSTNGSNGGSLNVSAARIIQKGIIRAGDGGDGGEGYSGGQGGKAILQADFDVTATPQSVTSSGKGGNAIARCADVQECSLDGNFSCNCPEGVEPPQAKFGKGGDLWLWAPNVKFQGQATAGKSLYIEPDIMLSGTEMQLTAEEDVVVFGGDGWELNLSNLSDEAIVAGRNIILAVGAGGVIDLRGNSSKVFKAGGKVEIHADTVLLDEGVQLEDLIEAEEIIVGHSKILYHAVLSGYQQVSGQPNTTVPISLTVYNGGPKEDTYTLSAVSASGWVVSGLPTTLPIEGLGQSELALNVTLPATPGATDTITVTATSQADPTVVATTEIRVNVIEDAGKPTASFTASPISGDAPLEVSLDASASSDDPDGTIESYTWAASNEDTANGVTTTMTFTKKGSYLIVLTVTDNDGNTATTERTISVGSPNLVGLANFTATTKDDGIHLDWETVSEIDNAGFYIVRARDENGKYTEVIRITEQLIQSVDGSINGASYSYVDSNVISGNTFYYALEDIEFSGKRTIHLEFIDSATAK
ncbi:PKD domain-containing protein, partial [Candidatus Marithioploca araucensis]|nr:PKD domain-containing protein [Candidatus Marithioploca araucensis]